MFKLNFLNDIRCSCYILSNIVNGEELPHIAAAWSALSTNTHSSYLFYGKHCAGDITSSQTKCLFLMEFVCIHHQTLNSVRKGALDLPQHKSLLLL